MDSYRVSSIAHQSIDTRTSLSDRQIHILTSASRTYLPFEVMCRSRFFRSFRSNRLAGAQDLLDRRGEDRDQFFRVRRDERGHSNDAWAGDDADEYRRRQADPEFRVGTSFSAGSSEQPGLNEVPHLLTCMVVDNRAAKHRHQGF
ncbi:MAG: hypothetical protein EOP30_08755 [Rhodococcus sp. (in: high G+C Gram-positive bacteria)]|nr:MAG: hypothetical protein EOP30_08755 [Rhodococcus sp. (in: high G+C Gram-positive bacteria)]